MYDKHSWITEKKTNEHNRKIHNKQNQVKECKKNHKTKHKQYVNQQQTFKKKKHHFKSQAKKLIIKNKTKKLNKNIWTNPIFF